MSSPESEALFKMVGGLAAVTEQILADPANAATAPSVPTLFCSLLYFMDEAGVAYAEAAGELRDRVLREL